MLFLGESSCGGKKNIDFPASCRIFRGIKRGQPENRVEELVGTFKFGSAQPQTG